MKNLVLLLICVLLVGCASTKVAQIPEPVPVVETVTTSENPSILINYKGNYEDPSVGMAYLEGLTPASTKTGTISISTLFSKADIEEYLVLFEEIKLRNKIKTGDIYYVTNQNSDKFEIWVFYIREDEIVTVVNRWE